MGSVVVPPSGLRRPVGAERRRLLRACHQGHVDGSRRPADRLSQPRDNDWQFQRRVQGQLRGHRRPRQYEPRWPARHPIPHTGRARGGGRNQARRHYPRGGRRESGGTEPSRSRFQGEGTQGQHGRAASEASRRPRPGAYPRRPRQNPTGQREAQEQTRGPLRPRENRAVLPNHPRRPAGDHSGGCRGGYRRHHPGRP